ncbi:hypothetical protein WA158_001609 [Blastocystis sp. Blastoise]
MMLSLTKLTVPICKRLRYMVPLSRSFFFKTTPSEPTSNMCGIKLYKGNSTTIDGFDKALESFATYDKNPCQIMDKVLITDPDFIWGNVFNGFLSKIYGYEIKTDSYSKVLQWIEENSTNTEIPKIEKYLASAYIYYSHGNIRRCTNLLENILLEQPTNLFIIKILQDIYDKQGAYSEMISSIYRVWAYWNPKIYAYKYIFGLRSYAQVQNGNYQQSEETALEGLNNNHEDIPSLHSLLHILGVEGRLRESMRYLRECEDSWENSSIQVHFLFHKCINHIEQGNTQFAINTFIDLLEGHSNNLFNNLIDQTNLLYRFELEGKNMKENWILNNDYWNKYPMNNNIYTHLYKYISSICLNPENAYILNTQDLSTQSTIPNHIQLGIYI